MWLGSQASLHCRIPSDFCDTQNSVTRKREKFREILGHAKLVRHAKKNACKRSTLKINEQKQRAKAIFVESLYLFIENL